MAEKKIQTVFVDVCATCGTQVVPIVQHRSDVLSYADRLRTMWRYPFCLGGIVGMVATGFLCACGAMAPQLMAAPLSIFWGFMFLITYQSALGNDDIGPPDYSSRWETMIEVLLRAIVATTASWAPLLFYLVSVKPNAVELLVDPFFWLLLVVGIAHAPMAFLAVAMNTSLVHVINPLWLARCVKLLGRQYWLAFQALIGLLLVQVAIVILGYFIVQIPVPILPIAAVFMLLMYPLFLMARVVGLLVYVHGDKIGYGDPNDYFSRVVTERPRGRLIGVENVDSRLPDVAASEEHRQPIHVDFG